MGQDAPLLDSMVLVVGSAAFVEVTSQEEGWNLKSQAAVSRPVVITTNIPIVPQGLPLFVSLC